MYNIAIFVGGGGGRESQGRRSLGPKFSDTRNGRPKHKADAAGGFGRGARTRRRALPRGMSAGRGAGSGGSRVPGGWRREGGGVMPATRPAAFYILNILSISKSSGRRARKKRPCTGVSEEVHTQLQHAGATNPAPCDITIVVLCPFVHGGLITECPCSPLHISCKPPRPPCTRGTPRPPCPISQHPRSTSSTRPPHPHTLPPGSWACTAGP
mmetsp:Transcript_44851/g.122696  ORF Transcript_44851/g.122696 Transcript_44851/m.122696 type:complete len:212 (+) Transcript_44851:1477-2112(+)